MTIKLFFTGGGGAGTIEAIRALKALGDYEIATADASLNSGGFAFADRGYVIPFGADPRFDDAFREIMRREQPHYVVPLVDEEIPKVHRILAAEMPDVRVIAPTLVFCELVLDKWTMAQALVSHGLAVARTWLASDVAGLTYPAIIKPRQGRGSRGLAFLEGPADLERYLAAAAQPPNQYVAQERLFGPEYTTSAVVGLDGTLLAVVPKEVIDKRGITHVGVTRNNLAIDELCRGIAGKLDARGPFNVQLILGADGVPRVIEINPRYSTTMALTLAAGVNEVDAVVRRDRGEDPGRLTFEADLMMVRYTAQVYVKEQEWRPTDLRDPAAR